MKESKFIKVEPYAVNSTIEVWQNFGWELLGAPQEIFNKTAHRSQETDTHYSREYTDTTHYVKITFQRDKAMHNYAELVELERKYHETERRYNAVKPDKYDYPLAPEANGTTKVISIILIVLGFFAWVGGTLTGDTEPLIIGYLFIGGGIALLVWRVISYQIRKGEYLQACNEVKEKNIEADGKARNMKKDLLSEKEDLLKHAQALMN